MKIETNTQPTNGADQKNRAAHFDRWHGGL